MADVLAAVAAGTVPGWILFVVVELAVLGPLSALAFWVHPSSSPPPLRDLGARQ